VRYVYAKLSDITTTSLLPQEAKLFDFGLLGITVSRELFMGMEEQGGQGIPVPVNIDYKSEDLGVDIYDPQEKGEPYVELPMPGKLTLFFPRGLSTYKRATLTMQYTGEGLRYQVDIHIYI
jgi:hypothetical protein